MGSLIRVRCKNCYEDWSLHLGYGLMHGRIEPVLSLFPIEISQKLPTEQLRDHDLPWSFAFEPAECEHCKALIALPVLRISDDRDPQYPSCPECGGSVTLIREESLPQTPCPSCGAETLEVIEEGLWD